MSKLNAVILVLGILVSLLYVSLGFFYLAVMLEKRKLETTNDIQKMGKITFKMINKYNFSKEKILQKLSADELKINKLKRFILLSIIVPLLYFFLRLVSLMVYPIVGENVDFPNQTDCFVFLLLLISINIKLFKKVLLNYNRLLFKEVSRLL